jgi:hypothetical protein
MYQKLLTQHGGNKPTILIKEKQATKYAQRAAIQAFLISPATSGLMKFDKLRCYNKV